MKFSITSSEGGRGPQITRRSRCMRSTLECGSEQPRSVTRPRHASHRVDKGAYSVGEIFLVLTRLL